MALQQHLQTQILHLQVVWVSKKSYPPFKRRVDIEYKGDDIMKKKVAILIAMIAVSILAGCGSKKETYSTNSEYVDNYIKKVEVDTLSSEDFPEPDTGVLPKRFEKIQESGIVPEGFGGKEHDNSQFPPEMFWGRWDVVSFNGVKTDQIETDVMVKLGNSDEEIA